MLFDTGPADQALDAILSFQYPDVDITPLLLSRDVPTRLARKEQLGALLSDIEDALHAVHSLETKIATIRQGLTSRASVVANACAPASVLPVEILQHIMRHALFGGYSSLQQRSQTSVRISQVSSQWRAISLGMPELWDAVHIPSGNSYGSAALLAEFAGRSGKNPLKVFVRKPSTQTRVKVDAEYAISCLTYIGDTPADLSIFSTQNVDALVLSSTVDCMADDAVHFPLRASFLGLKRLKIHGMPVSNSSGGIMSRLQEVNVSSMSVTHLAQSLESIDAPLLEDLSIFNIEVPSEREDLDALLDNVIDYVVEASVARLELYLDDPMAFSFVFPVLEQWCNRSITTLSITLMPCGLEEEYLEYEDLDDAWAGFVSTLLLLIGHYWAYSDT